MMLLRRSALARSSSGGAPAAALRRRWLSAEPNGAAARGDAAPEEPPEDCVAISSWSPLRRSDVHTWLRSLDPPIDLPSESLVRRYDALMVPKEWVVVCPAAAEALRPLLPAEEGPRRRGPGGQQGSAGAVPPVGLAAPKLEACALPAAPAHPAVSAHPERVVHLAGLQNVDIGHFGRDRAPLIASWITEKGFDVSRQAIHSVPGATNPAGKRSVTGRYLVTLGSSAEAERLTREMHGSRYPVSSALWKGKDKEVCISAVLMD